MSRETVALSHFLRSHQLGLRRLLLLSAAVAVLGAIAVAPFLADPRAQRHLLFYLAPPIFALPLWLRDRLRHLGDCTRRSVTLDALAIALAAARLVSCVLPFSGHMLFFLYTALTTRSRGYRALAWALAAETTYFKLALWNDPLTWTGGIVTGVALALLHRRAAQAPTAPTYCNSQ